MISWPSASVPANVIVLAVCSTASTVWAVAVGASFTRVIFIVTVAASLSTVPSLTLKVKLSDVSVSEVAVYVTTFPSNSAVPFVGWSTIL